MTKTGTGERRTPTRCSLNTAQQYQIDTVCSGVGANRIVYQGRPFVAVRGVVVLLAHDGKFLSFDRTIALSGYTDNRTMTYQCPQIPTTIDLTNRSTKETP